MISACVLREIKEIAEEFLNEAVNDAVITVPAHFNDAQRQATKDAAEIAGLNVLQLLNEPTAAAVAYGLSQKLTQEHNILVFDWGGGTFDVSILTIDNEVYDVKAVGGNNHLGGGDFNNKILDHFVNEIQKKHGVNVSDDSVTISRLLQECEAAKITLSTLTVADFNVNFNGIDFKSSITRARFEELNDDFFKEAIRIVEETILDAKLEKSEIHEVILVGGSTYIPKVQKMLQKCFNGKVLNNSIKPDEAVAYGAAVLASTLNCDDMGFENLVLLDVTPLSLGVSVRGGRFHILIPRNTHIPVSVSSSRFSVGPNKSKVVINVFEGERKLAIKNHLLGSFVLNGLKKCRPGQLKIDVTFQIDSDGILEVSAVETSSGIRNSIKVDVYKNADMNTHSRILEAERFKFQDEIVVRALELKALRKRMKQTRGSQLEFKQGVSNFNAAKFDDAFNNFTKVLMIDKNNVDAMENRAIIHNMKGEYEECVIECQELLKIKISDKILQLLESANNMIIENEQWHEVLQVNCNSSRMEVDKQYRNMARVLSPTSKQNSKLLPSDKLKLTKKMARINCAKNTFDNL